MTSDVLENHFFLITKSSSKFVDLVLFLRLSLRSRQSVNWSLFHNSFFLRGNWWIGLTSKPLASLQAIGGPISSFKPLASLEAIGGPVSSFGPLAPL